MIQGKGYFGGSENRRSPRQDRRFHVVLEYEGKIHEVRTVDISKHGILIPRRLPPPIGTKVKVTLTIRDEMSTFEGIVKRHTKCFLNGVQTDGIGIDFSSPEYQEFLKNKIAVA